MRDFLFQSEELLDKKALQVLDQETIPGILPCKWVRWNSMIQLVYFTDSMISINEISEELSLDELCRIAGEILDYVESLEAQMDLSLENVVWDLDTIYLDEDYQVHIICLPAVIPVEALDSKIYVKRVYAVLTDLFSLKDEEGSFLCRQIDAQQEKDAANWEALRTVLSMREPSDDETIVLRGINTPEPVSFLIGHEEYIIGSDETADGYLPLSSISAAHVRVGWNDISFYIEDLGSGAGTWLNDVQLTPGSQVPIGQGSVLKFGEYTFIVE